MWVEVPPYKEGSKGVKDIRQFFFLLTDLVRFSHGISTTSGKQFNIFAT
jgi:hypothetical protein